MKLTAPDYYSSFRCIAEECTHNCCIGWEIDIDSETAELYKNTGGNFGKRLAESISQDGGTSFFRLTEDERCPFLNTEGLCDIFTELGEESLCQICSDHPRFRNYFSDRTEIGLGLCCEAAGKLILGKTEKTCLTTVENDGAEEKLFEDEKLFFDLRDRVFEVLQNRSLSIDERTAAMLTLCGCRDIQKTPAELAEIYFDLERLDSAWSDILTEIKKSPAEESVLPCADEFDIVFEQLLVYFVYRHLAGCLDDGRLTARAVFAVQSFRLIRAVCGIFAKKYGRLTIEDIAEAARMYSSEIEYSDENIEILLGLFDSI